MTIICNPAMFLKNKELKILFEANPLLYNLFVIRETHYTTYKFTWLGFRRIKSDRYAIYRKVEEPNVFRVINLKDKSLNTLYTYLLGVLEGISVINGTNNEIT